MRRHWQVSVALLTALFPAAAFGAVVVVAPTDGAAAPLLSLPGMLACVLLLTIVAAIRLQRKPALLGGVMAALLALAGVGYAGGVTLTIEGEACGERTEVKFDCGDSGNVLASQCSGPITIIDIDLDQDQGDVVLHGDGSLCHVGLVLNSGETCQLPKCVPG